MTSEYLFPVYECSGTPYEIGLAHGSQGRKQISTTIENYKSMFWDYSGINWEQAKKYALKFVPNIIEYDSDIMEEIRGIADGSGFELGEILALNVRSELVLQGEVAGYDTDGCSSFAFTPYMTEDGSTLIGQNWDWKMMMRKGIIILKIHQNNKPDVTMFTEAGIVGKIGINSKGIAVCINALASDKKPEGKTIPLHVAMRGVLNSETLADALQAVGTYSLETSVNFTMASREGQALCVEICPGDIDVIYADDDYCVHTNHFYGPRMVNIKDTGRISFPDSYLRLGRMREVIRHWDKKVNTTMIKELLRDHSCYPDAICRHEDPLDAEGKRICTVFSIIMNATTGQIEFAPGNPCEEEYMILE